VAIKQKNRISSEFGTKFRGDTGDTQIPNLQRSVDKQVVINLCDVKQLDPFSSFDRTLICHKRRDVGPYGTYAAKLYTLHIPPHSNCESA